MHEAPLARECLGAQTLTAPATTASDDLAAVAGGHASAKAVGPLALNHTGLKGPLHGTHPSLSYSKRAFALEGPLPKRDADSRSAPSPCQSPAPR